MKKRLFATLLACAMTVSLVACGGSSSSAEKKEDTSDSKKQEASTEKEVTDITKMSDDEIKEAMKKEPAWGTTITAEYDGGDCTSGPSMAKALVWSTPYCTYVSSDHKRNGHRIYRKCADRMQIIICTC